MSLQSGASLEHLMENHHVCARDPGLLMKYIKQVPPLANTDHVDWLVESGSPVGLPWKVFKAWKKKVLYIATCEELSIKDASRTEDAGSHGSLSRRVYSQWCNGVILPVHASLSRVAYSRWCATCNRRNNSIHESSCKNQS